MICLQRVTDPNSYCLAWFSSNRVTLLTDTDLQKIDTASTKRYWLLDWVHACSSKSVVYMYACMQQLCLYAAALNSFALVDLEAWAAVWGFVYAVEPNKLWYRLLLLPYRQYWISFTFTSQSFNRTLPLVSNPWNRQSNPHQNGFCSKAPVKPITPIMFNDNHAILLSNWLSCYLRWYMITGYPTR